MILIGIDSIKIIVFNIKYNYWLHPRFNNIFISNRRRMKSDVISNLGKQEGIKKLNLNWIDQNLICDIPIISIYLKLAI